MFTKLCPATYGYQIISCAHARSFVWFVHCFFFSISFWTSFLKFCTYNLRFYKFQIMSGNSSLPSLHFKIFYRFIVGVFPQGNWLPLKKLKKNRGRVDWSSKLRLNFFQGSIIRILLALWDFVLREANKCWCMSISQMVHWRKVFQVYLFNSSAPTI